MDAHNLVFGNRKHIERIIVSQIGFHGKRKLCNIRQGFQIIRMDTRIVKGFFIKRNICVGMVQRPFKTL